MNCRAESTVTHVFRFCPGDPPVPADRVRALLRARLVDEITQTPVTVDVVASTALPGASPRVAAFGRVGLVGRPLQLFPDLDLSSSDLDLHVQAVGYLPVDVIGTLGPVMGFPGQFAAADLGDIPMHRVAVALRGRTLRRGNPVQTVVAGATVELVGYWPVFPPASVAPPAVMQPANMVHVSPGVYAARSDGVATLSRRAMPALAGADKRLLAPAARGERRLRLSDRISVIAGTVLIVHADGAPRRERMVVDQVDTSSSDDQPAWITLVHPLAHTHLRDTLCSVADPQVAAPPAPLDRPAIAGDETVFLDNLAGLGEGDVVEIAGGVGAEYHEISLYRTTSDGSGYFQLPPLSRAAMVLLHAQRAGLVSPDDAQVAPDYRIAGNRLTVLFP